MSSSSMPRRAARSAVGFFDKSDEKDVAIAVIGELQRRSSGELQMLETRYMQVVHEPDRQAAVRELVRKMQASTSAMRSEDLPLITELLYFAEDKMTMAKHRLIFPAYNTLTDYDVNKLGPWGASERVRPTTGRRWKVLGREVDFPIGIAASPLTANSKWIAYWAANGYNVITYKTVRSRETKPHTAGPHWVVLPDVTEPFEPGHEPAFVRAEADDWCVPGDPNVSSANSFGIPSERPEVWKLDVTRSLQALYEDQLLIVSVLGDIYPGDPVTREQLAADFLLVAQLAYEAGARVIELNLSCPNLLNNDLIQPPLCEDRLTTTYIVRYVRENLPDDATLVAKLSSLSDEALGPLLRDIGDSVHGISGINTLQRPVLQRTQDSDTFPGRHVAGVSGIAIRKHARLFVQAVNRFKRELGLDFDIIAMGGVTSPESFYDLKSDGAAAVQAVTGAFANPQLASDLLNVYCSSLEDLGPVAMGSVSSAVGAQSLVQGMTQEQVLQKLSGVAQATSFELAAAIGVRVGRTLSAIDELERIGAIESVGRRSFGSYRLARRR